MSGINRTLKIAAVGLLVVFMATIAVTYNFLDISYRWQDKNNVILEGWLGAPTLEKLTTHIKNHKPDSIYLFGWQFESSPTGIVDTVPPQMEKNSIKLIGNSTIHITPDSVAQENSDSSLISFILTGDSAQKYAAHYSLFINNHLIRTGFAGENPLKITEWLPLQKIKAIAVTFDNDTRTEMGDRNLGIASLSLNNIKLTSSNSTWAIHRSNFTSIGLYHSNAQFVKQYLHDLGVDTAIIQTYLTTLPPRGNTLALARKFHQIQQQHMALQSARMYIFGDHTHALRSLISFRRAAYHRGNIGIYTSIHEKEKTTVNSFRNKLKETFTVIFVMLFFHL